MSEVMTQSKFQTQIIAESDITVLKTKVIF